jgi:hypothetical protein
MLQKRFATSTDRVWSDNIHEAKVGAPFHIGHTGIDLQQVFRRTRCRADGSECNLFRPYFRPLDNKANVTALKHSTKTRISDFLSSLMVELH